MCHAKTIDWIVRLAPLCLVASAAAQTPPTLVSQSFASAGNGVQHFDFVLTSGTSQGWQLQAVWVKLGHYYAPFACESVIGPAAYLAPPPPNVGNPLNPASLWQVNDEGTRWEPNNSIGLIQPSGGPNPTPNANGSGVTNNQCKLIGDGGSYTKLDDGGAGRVRVHLAIKFNDAISGAYNVWLAAVGPGGWLPWTYLGPHRVTNTNTSPPLIQTSGPDRGRGRRSLFTWDISEPNGVVTAEQVHFKIADSATQGDTQSCSVVAVLVSGTVALFLSDSAGGWSGPIYGGDGASPPLQNSYCKVYGANTMATYLSPQMVRVTADIEFLSGFGLAKGEFRRSFDNQYSYFGWAGSLSNGGNYTNPTNGQYIPATGGTSVSTCSPEEIATIPNPFELAEIDRQDDQTTVARHWEPAIAGKCGFVAAWADETQAPLYRLFRRGASDDDRINLQGLDDAFIVAEPGAPQSFRLAYLSPEPVNGTNGVRVCPFDSCSTLNDNSNDFRGVLPFGNLGSLDYPSIATNPGSGQPSMTITKGDGTPIRYAYSENYSSFEQGQFPEVAFPRVVGDGSQFHIFSRPTNASGQIQRFPSSYDPQVNPRVYFSYPPTVVYNTPPDRVPQRFFQVAPATCSQCYIFAPLNVQAAGSASGKWAVAFPIKADQSPSAPPNIGICRSTAGAPDCRYVRQDTTRAQFLPSVARASDGYWISFYELASGSGSAFMRAVFMPDGLPQTASKTLIVSDEIDVTGWVKRPGEDKRCGGTVINCYTPGDYNIGAANEGDFFAVPVVGVETFTSPSGSSLRTVLQRATVCKSCILEQSYDLEAALQPALPSN